MKANVQKKMSSYPSLTMYVMLHLGSTRAFLSAYIGLETGCHEENTNVVGGHSLKCAGSCTGTHPKEHDYKHVKNGI